MKKYPLAQPNLGIREERAVLSVLRSGILSMGPNAQEFEKRFAKKIGTKYAVAVSSGTAGLHLALIAAGVGPGDEVITSPFSFVASANAVLYVGAKPVFIDIDPHTYNLDPKKIESAITKKTKAILAVHMFGQSCNMDPIMKLAKKHKLKVIEDACESIGAQYKGKHTGTFGESAVFAFYPNKQMTTGEGGMVVTNSKKIYEQCRSLRNQGRAENMQWLDHTQLGYNYRMDEMSAALGLAQLKRLDLFIAERRKIAQWYQKYLARHKDMVQAPAIAPENTHTWFVYVVQVLLKGANRDAIMKRLEKKGIATKPYVPSIHLFDFYRKAFKYKKGDYPHAESASKKSLALPFYMGLKEKDICVIVNELLTAVKAYGKRI